MIKDVVVRPALEIIQDGAKSYIRRYLPKKDKYECIIECDSYFWICKESFLICERTEDKSKRFDILAFSDKREISQAFDFLKYVQIRDIGVVGFLENGLVKFCASRSLACHEFDKKLTENAYLLEAGGEKLLFFYNSNKKGWQEGIVIKDYKFAKARGSYTTRAPMASRMMNCRFGFMDGLIVTKENGDEVFCFLLDGKLIEAESFYTE